MYYTIINYYYHGTCQGYEELNPNDARNKQNTNLKDVVLMEEGAQSTQSSCRYCGKEFQIPFWVSSIQYQYHLAIEGVCGIRP